jgi:hypothetical protein
VGSNLGCAELLGGLNKMVKITVTIIMTEEVMTACTLAAHSMGNGPAAPVSLETCRVPGAPRPPETEVGQD